MKNIIYLTYAQNHYNILLFDSSDLATLNIFKFTPNTYTFLYILKIFLIQSTTLHIYIYYKNDNTITRKQFDKNTVILMNNIYVSQLSPWFCKI